MDSVRALRTSQEDLSKDSLANSEAVKDAVIRTIRDQADRFEELSKQASLKSAQEIKELRPMIMQTLDSVRADILSLTAKSVEQQRSKALQHVTESLLFPEIFLRKSRIPEAHQETFEWIFDESRTSFADWLKSCRGLYWVKGKAGSGKSTLLKFIATHPQTHQLLSTWTDGKPLILASFFFWSAGHPMGKTHLGLLQSLVYQIFFQCPKIIETVSPGRFERAYHSTPKCQEPWTRSELSTTFDAIVEQRNMSACFCFLVDGLDEYSGDNYKLVQDLERLASSDNVKVCASSRPWNVFRTAFEGRPGLQITLEDLTYERHGTVHWRRVVRGLTSCQIDSITLQSSELGYGDPE